MESVECYVLKTPVLRQSNLRKSLSGGIAADLATEAVTKSLLATYAGIKVSDDENLGFLISLCWGQGSLVLTISMALVGTIVFEDCFPFLLVATPCCCGLGIFTGHSLPPFILNQQHSRNMSCQQIIQAIFRSDVFPVQ